MHLYRSVKRELDREPDNREDVLRILREETSATNEEAWQLAQLFWYLQEQLDDAAILCGRYREKIRRLQQN